MDLVLPCSSAQVSCHETGLGHASPACTVFTCIQCNMHCQATMPREAGPVPFGLFLVCVLHLCACGEGLGCSALSATFHYTSGSQEQQALVFQMIQQIQQKRELQRLQMTGSSQLPMTGLGPATSTSLLHSSSTVASTASNTLLSSISPQQLNPANSLMASPPLSTPGNSLMSAAAGAAIPPVLTAQTNPFLSLQSDSGGQKGMVSNV